MRTGSPVPGRPKRLPARGLRIDPRLTGRARGGLAAVRAHATASALTAIVAVAFTATTIYCLRLAGYFVMPDELGYVQQGTFIAEHLRPLLPSDYQFGSWSQLQPLLLAAPYGLFSTPTAFDVAHVLNALVMASTAVPAYLLTRRVVDTRAAALLVAALTVAVPWMALAGTMLTENVAYPAFVWALLAAHVAIVDPRPRHDALLLLAGLVAYAARTQLSLVVAAALMGIVLHEVGFAWRGGERSPLHRALGGGLVRSVTGHPVLVAGALAALVVVALGPSGALLGGYAAPTEGQLLPPGTLDSAREILAQVVAGIGVLPLGLTLAWIGVSLVAPRDARAHALAALALPTLVLVTLALGSFSVRFTAGVNDRYLFFFAPLLFAGTAALLGDRRRLTVPVLVGGAAAAWFVGSATLEQRGPSLVSPASAFHDPLADVAGWFGLGLPGGLAAMGVIGTVVVVALRLLAERGTQLAVVGGALLAFCLVGTGHTMVEVAKTQDGVSAEYLEGRDWVDRAVPGGGATAALLGTFPGETRDTSAARWWDTTFWNSDVRRVVRFDNGDDFIQKATVGLAVDEQTGAISGLGEARHVVLIDGESRLGLRDVQVAGARFGLTAYRLPPAPRAAWTLRGTDPGGRLRSSGLARLRVYGGARRVSLVLSGVDAGRDYRWTAAGTGPTQRGVIRDGEQRRISLVLRDGRATIRIPGADALTDVGLRIERVRPS